MNRGHKRRLLHRRTLKQSHIHQCKYEQETKRLYIYRAIEKLNNRMNNVEAHIQWVRSTLFPFAVALILTYLVHLAFAYK